MLQTEYKEDSGNKPPAVRSVLTVGQDRSVREKTVLRSISGAEELVRWFRVLPDPVEDLTSFPSTYTKRLAAAATPAPGPLTSSKPCPGTT